jgi:hypothetical protein
MTECKEKIHAAPYIVGTKALATLKRGAYICKLTKCMPKHGPALHSVSSYLRDV